MAVDENTRLRALQDGVIASIRLERRSQDEQWGAHSAHLPEIWLAIIAKQLGKAAEDSLDSYGARSGEQRFAARWALREHLVKVAACAVAAVECMDDSRDLAYPDVQEQDEP